MTNDNLNKHRITTEVEVSRVLNDANAFPIAVGVEENFGILDAGTNAADAGEFDFVLAGFTSELDAIKLHINASRIWIPWIPILNDCVAIARFVIEHLASFT